MYAFPDKVRTSFWCRKLPRLRTLRVKLQQYETTAVGTSQTFARVGRQG